MEELLFDPQTSGGLLLSVQKEDAEGLLSEIRDLGLPAAIVGEVTEQEPWSDLEEKFSITPFTENFFRSIIIYWTEKSNSSPEGMWPGCQR